ncbi:MULTISPECIES: acetyl-CoA acetyltransferase [Pseudonocardia]|uniref:Thiolase n=2 Tax=Pseudonocardia TaxID=1847 RepID=A0A1Y2MKP3_PSEAH|nr:MULTISPECIES: acetyl-CoA acetyltransferase [Pseudonocardia]OSY35833.1 thiolase [Pseudonocardia autotrophica]TDN73127.1 acetyl-CoA acetyltransferase [Pseudonocardia autotrophica]BBG03846.1 thiolase [Pseudonocardia autotrophica]GEC27355.1 thiolase [Pseudonocardia saturnea]
MSGTRGSVAIAGVAESDLGKVAPGLTPTDLMAQGVLRALDDCGLRLADVDGLFAAATQVRMPTLALAEYLGVRPRYSDSSYLGGASFPSLLAHAQQAIEAGMCEVAVIAYGSTARSDRGKFSTQRDVVPYEDPYRPRLPVTGYALAAARHMHEFGTRREDLAEIAVAAREWARLNPKAWSRDPLTVDDVLASKPVSSPLTVRDCCLVTDGGGALVVVGAERAADLRRRPVYVLGTGEAQEHQAISTMPDLTETAAARSGAQAYAMAGVRPSDIDVAQLYDAFTITTLLFLEDLGFCPKGSGGEFVRDGGIAPGGRLPVNTGGGGLSYCHPGMFGLLLMIEAVRQLRGECGERQVGGAELAVAHANGGVLAAQTTTVLGTSRD